MLHLSQVLATHKNYYRLSNLRRGALGVVRPGSIGVVHPGSSETVIIRLHEDARNVYGGKILSSDQTTLDRCKHWFCVQTWEVEDGALLSNCSEDLCTVLGRESRNPRGIVYEDHLRMKLCYTGGDGTSTDENMDTLDASNSEEAGDLSEGDLTSVVVRRILAYLPAEQLLQVCEKKLYREIESCLDQGV